MEVGHVLIGSAGELLSVDAAFCDILRLPDTLIVGKAVLDVTAPADRQECASAIQRLRETGRGFAITKRLIRGDGSLIWARNTVAITVGADRSNGTIVATVRPIAASADRGPATLLDVARLHVDARRDRGAVCAVAYLDGLGWDIILALYVAEAEGRAIDVEMLAAHLGKSAALTDRWIRTLLAGDVVEIEYRNPRADAAKAYRLTAATHEKLEAFLTRTRCPS